MMYELFCSCSVYTYEGGKAAFGKVGKIKPSRLSWNPENRAVEPDGTWTKSQLPLFITRSLRRNCCGLTTSSRLFVRLVLSKQTNCQRASRVEPWDATSTNKKQASVTKNRSRMNRTYNPFYYSGKPYRLAREMPLEKRCSQFLYLAAPDTRTPARRFGNRLACPSWEFCTTCWKFALWKSQDWLLTCTKFQGRYLWKQSVCHVFLHVWLLQRMLKNYRLKRICLPESICQDFGRSRTFE